MKRQILHVTSVVALALPLLLAGCSSSGNAGGPDSGGTTVTTTGGSGGSGSTGMTPVVTTITLTSSATSIGLSETADLTATVKDQDGNIMEGVTVSFTLSGDPTDATVTASATTGSGGTATAVVTPGNTGGDATVIASASGVSSNTVTVTITLPTASSLSVSILPAEITVNGQAVGTAVVKDADGNTLAGKTVAFSVDSGSATGATVEPGSATTDSAGIASATITPGNAVGTISVTATIDGLSDTASVSVTAASAGSIAFVSASPTLIGVIGSGLPETSTVTFEVQDETGTAVADNTVVTFELNASPLSDAGLLQTTALTSGGQASVVVTSGTVAGPVQVIASVVFGENTVSTASNNITVGSGPPSQRHFSIARSPINIAGRRRFGLITDVTAFVADRFSNFAPEGTAVAFVSEGGAIEAQGKTTPVGNTYLGSTTVKLQSQEPTPSDGWVDVVSMVTGEESFVDANGDGKYEPGEDIFDIGEPFIDQNDNGVWDGDDPDTAGVDESATDKTGDRTFDGAPGGNGGDFNSSCGSTPTSRGYFFDVDGDGVFDLGVDRDLATGSFTEFIEGNGFRDDDGDCQWDPGEVFIDPSGDGRYLAGVDYTDVDGDGAYDAGEAFIQEVFFDGNQENATDGVYDGPNGVWDDNSLVFDRIKVVFSGSAMTLASPSSATLAEDASILIDIYIGDNIGLPLAGNGTATVTIGSDGDGKVVGTGNFDVVDGMGTHFAVTVLNNTGATASGLAAVTVKVADSDNGDIPETTVALVSLD